MLCYVFMASHDVPYIPSKYVDGITGHNVYEEIQHIFVFKSPISKIKKIVFETIGVYLKSRIIAWLFFPREASEGGNTILLEDIDCTYNPCFGR